MFTRGGYIRGRAWKHPSIASPSGCHLPKSTTQRLALVHDGGLPASTLLQPALLGSATEISCNIRDDIRSFHQAERSETAKAFQFFYISKGAPPYPWRTFNSEIHGLGPPTTGSANARTWAVLYWHAVRAMKLSTAYVAVIMASGEICDSCTHPT